MAKPIAFAIPKKDSVMPVNAVAVIFEEHAGSSAADPTFGRRLIDAAIEQRAARRRMNVPIAKSDGSIGVAAQIISSDSSATPQLVAVLNNTGWNLADPNIPPKIRSVIDAALSAQGWVRKTAS